MEVSHIRANNHNEFTAKMFTPSSNFIHFLLISISFFYLRTIWFLFKFISDYMIPPCLELYYPEIYGQNISLLFTRVLCINTHSNRPVTSMWHFDTRSNATDLKFNEVAGPFIYGWQIYNPLTLHGNCS
jgi:hypothetical protein